MAWRRPGDKPLSEPMMVSVLTHICVTRSQWVNQQWTSLNGGLIIPPLNARMSHDVQSLCAINQPLLAHHWRVHECLLTSRFIAPSIPWGVSAPGGKMLKQLLKDHNFLDNSPIFIIESSTFNIFAFQKALHTIHFNWKVVLDLAKGTWHQNFVAGCGSLLWANTCSLWNGIKSWPGWGCLQRLARRSC